MSILKGEVEDCGQHLGSQIHRNFVNPVEGLARRQTVQNIRHALSNQAFQISQIARRHDTLHGCALHVMNRRVHRNKLAHREVVAIVADGDGRF